MDKQGQIFSFPLLLIFLFLSPSCAKSSGHIPETLLSPTIYFKPTIDLEKSKCEFSDRVVMLSPLNEALTKLCPDDFANCLMQGACFVVKGLEKKSYNYYALGADRIPRFTEVNLERCPYGYGVYDSCLDPYFSVAADLKLYKVGTVIYVPRVVGFKMPNGETHDGFFIIRDSGGRIKGVHRFDFFTGFSSHIDKENILATLGFDSISNKIEYRIATDSESEIVRKNRNYPNIKQ